MSIRKCDSSTRTYSAGDLGIRCDLASADNQDIPGDLNVRCNLASADD